jgi:hypothetical protein
MAHAPAAAEGAFRVDAAPALQGVVDVDEVASGVVVEGVQNADAAAGGVGHRLPVRLSGP